MTNAVQRSPCTTLYAVVVMVLIVGVFNAWVTCFAAFVVLGATWVVGNMVVCKIIGKPRGNGRRRT